MANAEQHERGIMSTRPVLESNPLVVLDEVSKRLEIDTLDTLDLCLLDKCPFKADNPGKWPSWEDLDISSYRQGNPSDRGGVIKAIHDLCSKVDLMLDRPACQKALGAEAVDRHRAGVVLVRKKLALLEDVLSPTDPWPLLTALDETDKRFTRIDLNNPEVSILDAFVFRSGTPGLFTTWTALDMTSVEAGAPSNRGAVITALRDLLSKSDQMLARPACQRALGSTTLEKYQSIMIAISEKLALLADTLSPPNLQPLLSMLDEVGRRFENIALEVPDLSILDSFAFHPGKPGLFTVWTDLDVANGRMGSPNNRGAVIMAVDDLLRKFDRMLARPVCQKTLEMTEIQKYRSLRNTVGEKLNLLKNSIEPTHPILPQTVSSAAVPFLIASPSPKAHAELSLEQEKIDVVKRRIGDQIPIVRPALFSRAAWLEAGAVAGSSMMAAILFSVVFHSFVRAIPIVGVMAFVFSFIRRKGLVTATEKRCVLAEDLYKKAITNNDILNVFPLLTRYAQAQFLVGLDSKFRENIAERYASLKHMCTRIDAFLLSCPESLDRVNALTRFPKEGLGEQVVYVLTEKEVGRNIQG